MEQNEVLVFPINFKQPFQAQVKRLLLRILQTLKLPVAYYYFYNSHENHAS